MYGLGDATLNGRELAVASYLTDHVVPLLIGRDARAHRGHLAVPVQGRLLAARAGDDERHRRRRHGAVGHQGQGLQPAGLPAARRRVARRRAGLRACQRRRRRPGASRPSPSYRRPRLQGDPRAVGHPRPESTYGVRRPARPVLRAGGEGRRPPENAGAPRPTSTSCRAVRAHAQRVRPDVHLLHDVHHRLTPIEAARVGKSLEPYRLCWMEDPMPAEQQEASA